MKLNNTKGSCKTLRAPFFVIIVCIMFTIVTRAELVVCQSCGYENESGSGNCTHCSGVLVQTAQKSIPDKPDTSIKKSIETNVDSLDIEIVADELRAARRSLRNGDVLVAKRLAHNALALNMLTQPDAGNPRSKAIMDFLRDCGSKQISIRRNCPRCGGSGKRFMRAEDLHGSVNRLSVPGSHCTKCDGKGTIAGRETVVEKKLRIAQAAQRYRILQQGRKRISIGQAWFPLELENNLSIRQKITLKCAAPMPCPECMGLMRADCPSCNGRGRQECTNSDCKNGLVEAEHTGLKGSTISKRNKRCRICGGNGIIACEKCNGAGTVLCKKCNGSGECSICTKCNGTGSSVCRKCKGNGIYKGETCVYCKGGGIGECTSCSGTGRKRK